MTFVAPTATQQLHVKVLAAFGSTIADDPGTWVFTDITKYARPNLSQITLSGGRSSLGTTADPAQISLSLDNTDGRFTARNPLSPYWPNVVRNVPLQVAITWDGATTTYELLTAFVNGWPLQPNAGVLNVSVPITASGRLRRLRKNTQATNSPLFREITLNDSNYDGYWSMEDAAGSQQFAHGPAAAGTTLSNIPMPGVKRAALASNTAVPGSAALPDFSSGVKATAAVTQINTSAAGFTVDHVLFVGDTPSGSGLVPLTRIFLANGHGSWQVSLDLSGQNWQVDLFDSGGIVQSTSTASWGTTVNPFDGQPHMIRYTTHFATLTLSTVLDVDGTFVLSTSTAGAFFGGNTSKIGIAGVATGFPLVIGHLAVWNLEGIADNTAAMLGRPGETASARVTRLCGEESIPVTVLSPAQAATSVAMGAQTIDTVANLLDSCADPDNGLLHDAGPNGGLVYASGASRYNAAVAMAVDFVRHQIGDGLASTYDDQDLVTEWTISRTGGSSATYKSATATDIYSSQDTVNVAADSQLLNIAGWRTHLGTYDAYRLPSISINMRKTPELAQAATTVELPFRLSPTGLPLPYPQESLDQFAEGFTTTVDSVQWTTSYACQPFGPWQAGIYGTSKYDSASSTVNTTLTATGTSLSVATVNAGDLWTTNSAQWTTSGPLLIQVDLEVMKVTNISGSSSPQTFTVVRGVSGQKVQHSAGTQVHIFPRAIYAL